MASHMAPIWPPYGRVGAGFGSVLFPGKCFFVKRLIYMSVRVKSCLVVNACIVVNACLVVGACLVVDAVSG